MTNKNRRGRRATRAPWIALLCMVLVFALAGGAAYGKKPPKDPPPPEEPPPTDNTTIFVRFEDYTYQPPSVELWSMDGNGGSRTQLVSSLCGNPSVAPVNGRPTHSQHGGHYWFVRLCPVGGTYPDGYVRRELFAVRDDGTSVQLTNDPTLAFPTESQPIWKPADDSVSFVALQWDGAGTGVIGGGIYQASVLFDADGNVLGLTGSPTSVMASTPYQRANGTWRTEFASFHDWSPTADRITFTRVGTSQAYVRVVSTGAETSLGPGSSVDWSPDGSRIAMSSGGVVTVKPDGTGLSVLVSDVSKKKSWSTATLPMWSPDSSRVVYRWTVNPTAGAPTVDLYRVDATGSNKVNLTTDAWVGYPEGWR